MSDLVSWAISKTCPRLRKDRRQRISDPTSLRGLTVELNLFDSQTGIAAQSSQHVSQCSLISIYLNIFLHPPSKTSSAFSCKIWDHNNKDKPFSHHSYLISKISVVTMHPLRRNTPGPGCWKRGES